MDEKFYSDWAVYKGKEYRCRYFADNIVELSDNGETFSVTKSELDDSYSVITYAILDSVQYVVYSIADGKVKYKSNINAETFIEKSVTDFEAVYNHKTHPDYIEREIIFCKDKKTPEQIFWAEEMFSENLMFSVLDSIFSFGEFCGILRKIYASRAEIKVLLPCSESDSFGTVRIDNIRFDISYDCGISTLSAKDEQGNGYILEIAEYCRKNAGSLLKDKKVKPIKTAS